MDLKKSEGGGITRLLPDGRLGSHYCAYQDSKANVKARWTIVSDFYLEIVISVILFQILFWPTCNSRLKAKKSEKPEQFFKQNTFSTYNNNFCFIQGASYVFGRL